MDGGGRAVHAREPHAVLRVCCGVRLSRASRRGRESEPRPTASRGPDGLRVARIHSRALSRREENGRVLPKPSQRSLCWGASVGERRA